jgi:hypothetical protein
LNYLLDNSLGHLSADLLVCGLAALLAGGLADVRVVTDRLLHLLATAHCYGAGRNTNGP